MRDVLDDLERWWADGETVGMATVVATWKSAPRRAGATMLAGPGGQVVGSLSGGCVEGAVYELAREAALTGVAGLHSFGVSDDDAFAVGLTCGGVLDVFVEPVDRARFPQLGEVAVAIRAGRPVATATWVAGPETGRRIVTGPDFAQGEPPVGTDFAQGGPSTDPGFARGGRPIGSDFAGVEPRIREMLRRGRTGIFLHGESTVFVAAHQPPPRMIIFGATEFVATLARTGKFLGYRVTVCDARPLFATAPRFPAADEVVVEWPHRYLSAEAEAGRIDERTVVCVLTHDPKFDLPALETALRLPVAYVGAMGSRRTHLQRTAQLRDRGLPAEALARLASPLGLDIGAQTPEETAVSIAAELILLRNGGTGRRLSSLDGPIHRVVGAGQPNGGFEATAVGRRQRELSA
ncbi:XdhC family protein [Actinoplanes sp. CA-142083]|uniref:XdhC family protein n=1 Tax=Actinoplanes sp. CA-142083 TaxID=3239903 RepID=UPI003D8B239E